MGISTSYDLAHSMACSIFSLSGEPLLYDNTGSFLAGGTKYKLFCIFIIFSLLINYVMQMYA